MAVTADAKTPVAMTSRIIPQMVLIMDILTGERLHRGVRNERAVTKDGPQKRST
jgi:hypothetical protein